jgi:hypothetical protein
MVAGGRDSPPTSLRLTASRTGHGGMGDAEGQPTLSPGRLCTSRAMIGARWGCEGTRGATVVRPVNRRLRLHRCESCPCHTTVDLRKRGCRAECHRRVVGRASLRFPPADAMPTVSACPRRGAEDALGELGDAEGGPGELAEVDALAGAPPSSWRSCATTMVNAGSSSRPSQGQREASARRKRWARAVRYARRPRAAVPPRPRTARGVRKFVHAARWYSCSRPPSRSRRCTLPALASWMTLESAGGCGDPSRSARCGR